ncbi:MAG: TatD family hydrolase [Patescibacteria group bacterium]|nr:TatD family hydrolase [Patescibacteria group bacterium]
MELRYFDIHSHVTFKDYDQDLPEVLARMEEQGVYTLCVGVDKARSEEAVTFSEGKENFYATVGLHPTDTMEETFSESAYEELLRNPKTVAVGECGIDYFRMEGDTSEEKKRQWREFEKHVDAALKYEKPLMIHCRPTKGTVDAYEEMAAYLARRKKEAGEKLRGNMHFFVGNVAVARKFYDIDFTTSFTGVLTFTHDYDDVVRFAPLEMIMTETDSPFAAPKPFRGRRNEPSYVGYLVEAIAKIRGITQAEAREATVKNALRMFNLPALM